MRKRKRKRKMTNQATMFLTNVTSVDYAYISLSGNIVGGSYDPQFKIYGSLNGKESVVVDFSTIKKDLKAIIDDKESGFDHKLLVTRLSKCSTEINGNNAVITTPVVKISVPKNALHAFGMWDNVEQFISDRLIEKHPNVERLTMSISHTPTVSTFTPIPPVLFTYVHGLKDSTSWGCQNIAHGHASYLTATAKNYNAQTMQQVSEALHTIANDLRGAMFVRKDNLNGNIISYDTGRGHFEIELTTNIKMIVLDTETTVENIAQYVAARYHSILKEAKVVELYVSEGLNKGSFVEI